MESSTSKAEIIKALLFKAGIPLTLSLAVFLFTKNLASRRVPKHSDSEEEEEASIAPSKLEETIIGLKTRIEEIQKKESNFETLFERYNDLKEQESMLMKLSHVLFLEIARVEFLEREISLMEDENRRVDDLAMGYLGALEKIESWKKESLLVQKKAKKLSRRVKVQSIRIRERDSKIREKETEILKTGYNVFKKLEDEVCDLKLVLDRVLDEKNELSKKLDSEQRSTSSLSKSKIEAESKAHEEESRAESELDQLKKDRASEVNEIVNLRWNNACLKHELTKIKEEVEQQDQQRDIWKLDFQEHVELGNYNGKEKTGSETEISDPYCSKRKRLMKRFRKWVEGCDKGKEKVGCESETPSVLHEANEHFHGRRSCSSA